jgi:O-antigen/teichoic acid export membrane protein
MPAEATLTRNTGYFTAALVAQKVISFLYFTFLARTLGPESVGRYVLALSLTTIFSVLLDLGLSSVLIREVAREPGLAERYVRLAFGFKVVMSLVAVAAVVTVTRALGYPTITQELVYLACIVMVVDSFILSAYSTIRGFHTLAWESIGAVLFQITVAAAGLTVSRFTHDLRWFMAALALGVLVHGTYALLQLKLRFAVHIRPLFRMSGWRELFILAWPFALAAVLLRIYGYIDTVLLSLMAGDRAVGFYSVAYKVTFALQFIPTAFSASLLPGFSAYFRQAPEKLGETFAHAVVYLSAIAVPISLGAVVLAPELVHVLYPAYTPAVVPLQVLMFSLMFLFLTFPVGSLLAACNRQVRNTSNIAFATLSSVVLNLLFIPLAGPTGAALASLMSTLVLLVLGWVVVRQVTAYPRVWLVGRLGRVLAAGLLMSATVFAVKGSLPLSVTLLMAVVVYSVLALVFRAITIAEITELFRLFRPKRV